MLCLEKGQSVGVSFSFFSLRVGHDGWNDGSYLVTKRKRLKECRNTSPDIAELLNPC